MVTVGDLLSKNPLKALLLGDAQNSRGPTITTNHGLRLDILMFSAKQGNHVIKKAVKSSRKAPHPAFMIYTPDLPAPFFVWNQALSYPIYWQLGSKYIEDWKIRVYDVCKLECTQSEGFSLVCCAVARRHLHSLTRKELPALGVFVCHVLQRSTSKLSTCSLHKRSH